MSASAIKVEPYWNVNIKNISMSKEEFDIKVEPYWNVNIKNISMSKEEFDIKVEPYWNVNQLNSSCISSLVLPLK